MNRGTRVGQAYVALTVDGDNINSDIAGAFDDVDYNEIGDKHGREYREGLEKHLDGLDKDFDALTKRISKKFGSRLNRALDTDSAISDSVAKTLARALDDNRLDDLFDHVGRRAGYQFGDGMDKELRRTVLNSLERTLNDAARTSGRSLNSILFGADSGNGEIDLLGPAVKQAIRDVEQLNKQMESKTAASINKRIQQERLGEQVVAKMRRDYEGLWEDLLDKREQSERAYTRFVGAEERKRLSDEAKAAAQRLRLDERSTRERERHAADYEKWWSKALDSVDKDLRDQENSWQRLGVQMERAIKMNEQFNAGRLDGRGDRISVSGNDRSIGDRVAGIFGKGSRNNVLNTLGSSIGGIVSLVDKGAKYAGIFASNFRNAGESASIMQRVLAGFGGGGGAASLSGIFSKIGPAILSSLPAVFAVIAALSIMASVIGALVAILTAMIATIASGLVGAIAVALPLLGAMLAVGGLLVAAFTSLTDAQRKYLSDAFQPLKAEMTGIGQIIATEFTKPLYDGRTAFQVWADNIARGMLPLAGVARATAGAFAESGNIITASLNGAGFQRFFASLQTELPTIVVNLSRALGGFLNGTLGMFAAIMPYVTRFSDYLSDVATRFSGWANSVAGQNSIVDFVDRALGSLKSLWGFLKQVGGLFSDIFFNPESQRAGNSIFDSISDAIADMRKAISKATKNGDLKRWFDDGIKFGGQLWALIKSLFNLFIALYNSGVLEAVGDAMKFIANMFNTASTYLAPLIDAIGFALPTVLNAVLGPIQGVLNALDWFADKVRTVLEWLGIARQQAANDNAFWNSVSNTVQNGLNGGENFIGPWAPGTSGNPMPYIPPSTLPDLIGSGNAALDATSIDHGGNKADPAKPDKPKFTNFVGELVAEWSNPYIAFANALIAAAPSLAEEIRKAGQTAREEMRASISDVMTGFTDLLKGVFKDNYDGILDASKSTDIDSLGSTLQGMIDSMGEQATTAVQSGYDAANQLIADAASQGQGLIDQAIAARTAAAQRLASATSQKEADAALKELRAADKALEQAYKQAGKLAEEARRGADEIIRGANATGNRLANAQAILNGQMSFDWTRINNLISGLGAVNATMADYAIARNIVAERLAEANQKLVDAISLRDTYAQTVGDAARTYGSLLTAQAKTINGIQQSLTVNDITENLQSRLTKIKAFQENLRQLLALGLSQDAYKQIVDAGVETGGAYAEAILNSGQGGISAVNDLTQQINDASTILGNSAANTLYQAGVDAAKGLVDGLNSLSSELETAATNLGLAIATAIRSALGIASPSKVLYAMMYEDAGDGMVNGLNAAVPKVASAAGNLAAAVAITPEAAVRASSSVALDESGNPVSGNQKILDIDIALTSNTEDPEAVAKEVVNEMMARL